MVIKCPNCGKELSEDSIFCNSCGNRILDSENTKKTITIFGYKEPFAINPSVKIYQNGKYIGSVNRNERFNLLLERDSLLEFKCSIRSTSINIPINNPQDIQLSFDRISGKLLAIIPNNPNISTFEKSVNQTPLPLASDQSSNEQISDTNSSSKTIPEIQDELKEKDKSNIVISVFIIILLFFVAFFIF